MTLTLRSAPLVQNSACLPNISDFRIFLLESYLYLRTITVDLYIPVELYDMICSTYIHLLSGEPDYFGRNKISSGGDLSHYSSASLY